jgi:hypothetical protein
MKDESINTALTLSDHIKLVHVCTNNDDRISIRTTKPFHELVKFLIKERSLTGEADLIEKAIIYYAGVLEEHNKKQHIMTDADLIVSKKKWIHPKGDANGLRAWMKVFGTEQQQRILNGE